MLTEVVAEHARRIADAAPELTPELKARLAAILRGSAPAGESAPTASRAA